MDILFKLILFLLFLTIGSPIFSQQKKDSLSIEQSLSVYSITNILFSPDGLKAVAEVSQTGSAKNLPATHLWMIDVASKSINQFTYSLKSERNARWSPDGKQIAFLSNRDGETQVYVIDMDGGEAVQLTESKTGVGSFEWNPMGKTIAYTSQEEQSAEAKKRADDKYDETVVSQAQKPTEIFIISVGDKKITRLQKHNWGVEEMEWMPSGTELVIRFQELPESQMPKPELVRFSIKDSAITPVSCPAHNAWGNLKISPDGKTFAYTGAREDGPVPHDLFIQSFAGNPKNISEKNLDIPVGRIKFNASNKLIISALKGFHAQLYEVDDRGEISPFRINKNIGAFDLSANGTVIFESGDANHLSELWISGADKKPVQISHFNKAFDNIPLVAPKILNYKSFDGVVIEAALYKPQSAATAPLPLMVLIHGGPTGVFTDAYNAWVQLFVQKGYAVFCPNIRGSTGYGWKFLASNRHDWGGGDFKDVMAGVDMLIAKENIDSSRMGISGWSYGGYMSEWAITQTDRFKAAISGAGLSNLASEFGTENDATYDEWFWGTPYEHQADFMKFSPVTYMKNAKTPTLIIQGLNDQTDPVGQSQELYRGLRYYKVPAELVEYPREPHGFREIKHRIDYFTRMLAWFDKYVNKK